MMKKTLIATALLASSSAALAEVSGNVTLASDYVFRGISQTDSQIAIQGGLDYAHPTGLYAGTWASNVDPDFFNGEGHDPQIELDLYAGYSGELPSGFGYDLGYLRYEYPGFNDADTNEVYLTGSYMGFSLSVNYSDELNFIASDESAWYWKAAYDTTLPWYEIGLSAHLGYSAGDAFDDSDGDGFDDTYTDWSIGFSKTLAGVDLGLAYTDTDFSDSDDEDLVGEHNSDARVVFTIGKSL
jgi:uncharacterized protein (TIGR02001 family)